MKIRHDIAEKKLVPGGGGFSLSLRIGLSRSIPVDLVEIEAFLDIEDRSTDGQTSNG